MERLSGCPCGCTTKLPWIDDPDCVRHRPAREPEGWQAILAELHGPAPAGVRPVVPSPRRPAERTVAA